MNSICNRLTIWLLCGFFLLWIAAGVGVYSAIHQSLLKSLDTELAVDARIVRFAAKGDGEELRPGGARRLEGRMPDYDKVDGDAFFHIWTRDGDTVEKSASLGPTDFPFPGDDTDNTPIFSTQRLDPIGSVRTMTYRFSSGGKGKKKGSRNSGGAILTIGKTTHRIEETLRSVLLGIGLTGFGLALGTIIMVRVGIQQGLKPLRALARQTSQIDTDSLDARFECKGIPEELQPVYRHLNELIDRLEAGFDRERQFSADLAHELRTPIAELKMINEVALKWKDQAGEQAHRESLAIVDQLGSTVETLLALARAESGQLQIRSEPIRLSEFISEIWKSFLHQADEKNLTLELQFDDSSPDLHTDKTLLRHIIANLLSNAIEYSPNYEVIHARQLENGFQIENKGDDIDEASLPHWFERHWRADHARTDSSHSGLGLPLAKACADHLEITLSLSLENGKVCASAQRKP